ncbi:MAG TPA: hypothetical protein PKY30_11215 [Myxococcota bacterium]|nr:hypothetical protein [Myxococcota bacterium]HNH47602.1 hypothetical protein [Myxococcota bacterium]
MWILGLALLFVPSVAWAQDGENNGVYALVGAAVFQVIIALVVGTVQAIQGRLQRHNDDALGNLKAALDEERKARVTDAAEFRAAITGTRDEYTKRVDTQAAIRALEEQLHSSERRWKEEHKEMKGKLENIDQKLVVMSAQNAEILGFLKRLTGGPGQ